MPGALLKLGVIRKLKRRAEDSGLGRAEAQDHREGACFLQVGARKDSGRRRHGGSDRSGEVAVKRRSQQAMKFLEAITNVFRVPDLRKRLLFTLALLAVYRLGGHIPTPGIDTNRLEEFFRAEPGHAVRLSGPVQRRQLPPADHFRAGHHALHHVVDHSAVVDGGGARRSKSCRKKASSGAARSRSGPAI